MASHQEEQNCGPRLLIKNIYRKTELSLILTGNSDYLLYSK